MSGWLAEGYGGELMLKAIEYRIEGFFMVPLNVQTAVNIML